MTFSRAQFEATLAEIDAGMTTFAANLDRIPEVARHAAAQWFITDSVADTKIWLATKTVEIGQDILNWFLDLLKGAVAPIFLAIDAWRWTDIRRDATLTAANLTDQNLSIDDSEWTGRARDAYGTTATAQAGAANRIGAIATSTAVHLLACAVAGAGFYITLAAVLTKLIAATVVIIAAYGSVAFSWVGAALMLEEAGVNTATIVIGLTTLAAFLGTQVTSMTMLHGDATDPTNFPNGAWPTSNTNQYNDATVTDGDADWSLKD